MSTYYVTEDGVRREATPAEIKTIDEVRQENEAQRLALEQAVAAKASARAKLAALGLTDAEVAALLGA